MLASVFAEYVGMQPAYASAVSMGGVTACMLVMQAAALVEAGYCRHVLVVTGNMGGRHLPGGNYAFATQSGALGTYWLDMTMKAGLGVSAWISTGNEADVDLAACLDYLAEDDETEVIGLYIEGIRDGAAFRATRYSGSITSAVVTA